jgi:hypothetical protein
MQGMDKKYDGHSWRKVKIINIKNDFNFTFHKVAPMKLLGLVILFMFSPMIISLLVHLIVKLAMLSHFVSTHV